MTFWTAQYGDDSKDPKRNFRWTVSFSALASDTNGAFIWYAKKCGKPNFTVTEAKHSYLNHTFYWPARVEWQKIEMTLVDPVNPHAAGQLNKLIEGMGYTIPGKPAGVGTDNHLSSMSKGGATVAMGTITITQFDGSGEQALEQWTLVNPFITSVKYGDLDYESDEITEYTLELRYDYAKCTLAGGSPNVSDVSGESTFFKPLKS